MTVLRAAASQSLAMIPAHEQPTTEDLEGYVPIKTPKPDLAWSELYPQLCAWLNDREVRKAEQAAHEAAQHDADSQFNYRR